MKEHSHLSLTGADAQQNELAPEQDSIELIESEMDILRQRMRRLESRMAAIAGNSTQSPAGNTISGAVASSDDASVQSSIILPPEPAKQNSSSTVHHRPRKRKSTRSDAKRPTRHHRKGRSNKVKKNLLLGYGLFIGVGVVSVFVLMVLNLFNADIYIPSGSPPTEIELDETPDLEELRMSIQEAGE